MQKLRFMYLKSFNAITQYDTYLSTYTQNTYRNFQNACIRNFCKDNLVVNPLLHST